MHSIIIPAYNEELRIRRTVEDYTKFFKGDYEFVVVCDGNDKTAGIVKKMSKRDKRIRIIISKKRLGKGGGIYKGFDSAKGNIIGFTDADGGVNPREYKKLLSYIKDYDCVIASRRIKGSKITRNRSWNIIIVSFIFNRIVNFLFNLGIKDTQCGAKITKKEVYNEIKNDIFLNGFEFDVELLWRIKKAGFTIKEVPIIWSHDPRSKTNIKNHPNLLYQIIKLRIRG